MQSLRINILLVWRRFVLLNLASSSSSSSTLFVFPLLFLFKCLLTAHVWLRKVQSLVYSEHFETIRGDIQYVKKKKNKKEAPYRLCFHSVLICLSSCLSWGLWQWKELGLVVFWLYFFIFIFFFFGTAALDHKLKQTLAAVLLQGWRGTWCTIQETNKQTNKKSNTCRTEWWERGRQRPRCSCLLMSIIGGEDSNRDCHNSLCWLVRSSGTRL